MKTRHLLAAIAWFAVFLGLARAAAGLLEVARYRLDFRTGLAWMLTTDALYFVTLPVAEMLWCLAFRSDGRGGCLGVITAAVIAVAAIGLFCWFGAR